MWSLFIWLSRTSFNNHDLDQWFSTCGPQKYFAVKKSYLHNELFIPWHCQKSCRKLRWMRIDLFFVFFWSTENTPKMAFSGAKTFFFFEITCLRPEKPFEFWWRPFFLEITWFWQKNRHNVIQDWWRFGSSSFTDVSSFQKSYPPFCETLASERLQAQASEKMQLSNTFFVKTFFLEITWFWQKNRLNLIQDWWKFGSNSFTDVSSFQKSYSLFCETLATLLLRLVKNCNWAILSE